MYFLPIVGRELRIASRRKSTHRIRVWTTFAALLVSVFFMVFKAIWGSFMPNLGPYLFAILAWYAFLMSNIAGVFLAADCISSEKRDGTLGLLFLTDLRGYDVVLGKLLSAGLSALYGLIAVLPVIGLSLLMGGVTGAEFWRVSLALVNALFFAFATGMLVSTCSRETAKALGATIALLVFVAAVVPGISIGMVLARAPAGFQYLSFFSPFWPFRLGFEAYYRSRSQIYWTSLLFSHFFAWLLLVLTSCILPRAWQDKTFRSRNRSANQSQSSGSFFSLPLWLASRRQKLYDRNPIQWLAESFGGVQRLVWCIVLLPIAVVGIIFYLAWALQGPGGLPVVAIGAASLLSIAGWLMKILFAFQATRFFVEARRGGALELILSTPLPSREIIDGQWRALQKVFLWPGIIFLAGMLILALAQMTNVNPVFTSFIVNGVARSANPYFNPASIPLGLFQFSMSLYALAKWVADIIAIGWVGMWLGLSMKQPNLATAATVLFVVILPSLAFCIPNPAIDLVFILWARGKLIGDFRLVAMPQYYSNRFVPMVAASPPVITPRNP